MRRDSVEELALGVYYANETRWSDRFRSVLGVRADRYEFDVTSNLAANSGSASDSLFSPKISLIYSLNDAAELYLSAGSGFHSNDARGTTITIDPVERRPGRRRRSARAGALGRARRARVHRERLNVSAALWRVELDSELLFIGDAGTTEASRPSMRLGIEVPLYYRPTDRVTLDFEVACRESQFTEADLAGDEIPGSIDRVLAAGFTFEQPQGLYGSARLRYFGDRPLVEDGSVESDSSWSSISASASPRRRRPARRRVERARQRRRRHHLFLRVALARRARRGRRGSHFHPIEPRTVRAHVSWKF